MANQAMDRSLEFAGYDVNHVWGDGGHNGKHGGSIFPDAMRWLWRDPAVPIGPAGPSKQPLFTNILSAGEDWQAVGPAAPGSPATNASGELVFAAGAGLDRLGADGQRAAFLAKRGVLQGFAFGPDGRLYAADPARKRVVSIGPDGREAVVAQGLAAHELAVAHDGTVYATEPSARRVWRIAKGKAAVVDEGIAEPSGIVLSPDQSLLLVADRKGVFVYSFQVRTDGTLAYKQPYFHLHVHEGETASEADGMAVDTNGYLYVATPLGVQICDQAGRVNGILARPQPGPLEPRRLRRARPGRALSGGRRHPLQEEDEDQGRAVVRGAGQARRPAALAYILGVASRHGGAGGILRLGLPVRIAFTLAASGPARVGRRPPHGARERGLRDGREARAAEELLRLPQRGAQERRREPDGLRDRGRGAEGRPHLVEGGPEGQDARDAARAFPAALGRRRGARERLDRGGLRARRGSGAARPRARDRAPAEPHRVRQLRARPARRRPAPGRGLPAGRHRLRLRQQRRRAVALAGALREVHGRRRPHRARGESGPAPKGPGLVRVPSSRARIEPGPSVLAEYDKSGLTLRNAVHGGTASR